MILAWASPFKIYLSYLFPFYLNTYVMCLRSQGTAIHHSTHKKKQYLINAYFSNLTLSSLNLPLWSSSTTSRELLSQFSTCSE